jgi:hypothetical protein
VVIGLVVVNPPYLPLSQAHVVIVVCMHEMVQRSSCGGWLTMAEIGIHRLDSGIPSRQAPYDGLSDGPLWWSKWWSYFLFLKLIIRAGKTTSIVLSVML